MITRVFALASRFSPVHASGVVHYPDLAALRRSVTARDWNAVSAYFQGLPARSDHSVAVRCVADIPRSERFLQRVVDSERDSSLARTLLGARFIVMGWDARTDARAQYVSQAQWQVFHDYLNRAERLLADAVAIDSTNAAGWSERIVVARGLGLDIDEARRRYQKAAEHCDVPYVAQTQLIQNLCPKWGGSLSAVHAFARECLDGSKPGSLGGCVVANAHIEHALMYETDYGVREYLGKRKVRDQLVGAAAHTVLNPAFEPGHGSIAAYSAFAFALFQGGWHADAAPHFAALGRRVHPYPWNQLDRSWKKGFLNARRAMRKQ